MSSILMTEQEVDPSAPSKEGLKKRVRIYPIDDPSNPGTVIPRAIDSDGNITDFEGAQGPTGETGPIFDVIGNASVSTPGTYFVDTTLGAVILTIPNPSVGTSAHKYSIFKTGGVNTVTVRTATDQDIGGAASQVITIVNTGFSVIDHETIYELTQDSRLQGAKPRWMVLGGINSISGNSVKVPSYGHTNAIAPPRMRVDGRVKGFSAGLSLPRTGGTCDVVLVVGGVVYNDPGDIATIDAANPDYVIKTLNTPIEFIEGDDIGGYSSTTGFTPTGSDITLTIDVEIDE